MEELNRTPVPRNLRTRPTFFGLEFEHCVVLGFLMFLGYVAGGFVHRDLFGIPMNFVIQYGVPLLGVPLLIAFQYAKPRGYLRDWLIFHVRPHLYCGAEPDTVLVKEYLRPERKDEAAAEEG
jgi:hypothetical protein